MRKVVGAILIIVAVTSIFVGYSLNLHLEGPAEFLPPALVAVFFLGFVLLVHEPNVYRGGHTTRVHFQRCEAGEMGPQEQQAFAGHLTECKSCREDFKADMREAYGQNKE